MANAPVDAEIIDFDPATHEVPQILSPEELALYAELRTSQPTPSIRSALSPDGRYVLVRVANRDQVLDTATEVMTPLDLGEFTLSSSPVWIGDTEAAALTRDRQRQYHKTVIDFSDGTHTSTPVTVPEIEGKQVRLYGGMLLRAAGDDMYVLAYTTTPSQPLLRLEKPTYHSDTVNPDVVDATDPETLDDTAAWLLQSQEQLLAVSLADGTYKKIDDLGPSTNLGLVITSLSMRPDSNTVSYIVGVSLPWGYGQGSRGGLMSTNYWNAREAMGLIPLSQNPQITERSLRLLDLETGQRQVFQNIQHAGSITAPAQFADTLWTADGSLLLVPSSLPFVRNGAAYPSYEYTSGTVLKVFTPSGGFVRDLAWSDPPMDGPSTGFAPLEDTRVLVSVRVNTTRHLYVVDAAKDVGEQALQPVYSGDRLVSSYTVGGDRFIASIGDVTALPELYLADVSDIAGTLKMLTGANAALRATSSIAYQPVTYPTSHGYEVTGIYVYPADWPFPPAEPKPVVVWQAGGPGGQMTNEWGTTVESPYSLLPNFGVPVFVINGSGRVSNGAQFYADMAQDSNFGQRDIADVKEGVEHLVGLGVVDPDAVGVTGCSYGGYFTLQSLTTYPGFYAAGNAQCSLNDLLYEWHFGYTPFMAYLMGSSATADPAEHIKDSPLYNAGKIEDALLLFHGTEDFLKFEHITNIHDQVEMNGAPARFFRAHGYGHGIGRQQNDSDGSKGQLYAFQLQLSWFREHLFGLGRVFGLSTAPPPFDSLPWLPLSEATDR